MNIIDQATRAQTQAADPTSQIFVEANAGSGKTRVLVDRVARLLLAGAEPSRILCLTYTKAAAGEMKSRLFKRLGDWSILPDDDLGKILDGFGELSDPGRMADARRLFARALETPGGLAVQTIHAFCESLLKRFPLEAGIPPGFEIIDDPTAARLIAAARQSTLLATRDDPSLAEALNTIAARGADKLDLLFKLARDKRHALAHLIENNGVDALIAHQYEALGLAPGVSATDLMAKGWESAPLSALESAAFELQTSGVNDQKRGQAISEALNAPTPEAAYRAYLNAFFSGGGEKTLFKSVLTKGFASQNPAIADVLDAEAIRMEQARNQVRAALTAEGGAAALRFAARFIDAYSAQLSRARKLDFADLVDGAARLLQQSEAADWVRYKMDGGVDHILVDEAQDTAPDQWAVIDTLAEGFFAGLNEGGIRTLFCVGDEKQSIYSFQGADPKRFIARGERLEAESKAAKLDFARPALSASFRSGFEVLASVDLAFGPEQALAETRAIAGAPETKFVAPDNDNLEGAIAPAPDAFTAYRPHQAARSTMPGLVEIWPAISVPEKPDEADPTGPVDRESRTSARNQLAQLIAREIKRIIADGDTVWDEIEDAGTKRWIQRAARPEDIMVLVRRREGFFDELIRQLKVLGVPVAGADRMTLKDQLAVEDLLGVARAALNPRDDLALAEVLKSPFFHPVGATPCINEDALFALAHKRKGTLWDALRSSDDPRFAEAREAMRSARARIETAGVYGFFSEFLTETSASGESRLKRLFARLGEEARDPVEEFLARALKFESDHSPSLTRFVAEMRGDSGTIKREMEAARGEVRVMTVHASKGLEAPIVILPDTTQAPKGRSEGGLSFHREHGLIWSLGKDADPPLLAEMRAADEAATEGEYLRLLYVALTRAKDRLLVAGWKHGTSPGRIDDRSWYARLDQLWRGEDWAEFETPILDQEGMPGAGRRFGAPPIRMPAPVKTDETLALPDWALSPAPAEAALPRSIAPSHLADSDEPAVLSPLLDPGSHRFRRGNLIHKLLQTLPELPGDARETAAQRYLERQPDLSAEDIISITQEILAVLATPDFAALFGPGSRAEVALAGRIPGLPEAKPVRGQVDRLVINDHEVLIVDYKTNRPPPKRVEDVATLYITQMAAYRALLQAMHAGKPVRCALLWTDGARLMDIPEAMMDGALDRLRHLDGAPLNS